MPPEGRGSDRSLLKAASLFEQVLERRAGIVRFQTRGRRGLLLTRHPDLVQRAIVPRILLRDPLFDRLHAFKAATGIKVGALLARVQLESAFWTLALARTGRALQHGPALRAS